jgi:hypothetical protein
MLSVTNKTLMLNVVMLNVVAPKKHALLVPIDLEKRLRET